MFAQLSTQCWRSFLLFVVSVLYFQCWHSFLLSVLVQFSTFNVGEVFYFQCWCSSLHSVLVQFSTFSVSAVFYFQWYPVISVKNCCSHSIPDFGHGQWMQMTLKRVWDSREGSPQLVKIPGCKCTVSFGSIAGNKCCADSLPDLNSNKKLPGHGAWGAGHRWPCN